FELLCTQLKYREAFDLADQAKAALQKLPDEAKERGKREVFELELCRARVLYNSLGEKDKALQLLAQLTKQVQDAEDPILFEILIETEVRLHLQDQALGHCAQLLERL